MTIEMDSAQLSFAGADIDLNFRVDDSEKRLITGLVIPWNVIGMYRGRGFRFRRGSLHWSKGEAKRVKLNIEHDHERVIGVAEGLHDRTDGLAASFRIARGSAGDNILSLAKDGIMDGFSAEVFFDNKDGYQSDGDEGIVDVSGALLRHVALTHEPAFEDSRLESVYANQSRSEQGGDMATENKDKKEDAPPAGGELVEFKAALGSFMDGMRELQKEGAAATNKAVGEGIAAYLADKGDEVHVPKAYPNIQFMSEPMIYTFGRTGPTGDSLIRDAYYAHYLQDQDANKRINRFREQQYNFKNQMMSTGEVRQVDVGQGAQFAMITTSGASQIIPPGYRPDLYVAEMLQGRPFIDGCSRGSIDSATAFTVPFYSSSSGEAQAVASEGTNPASGTSAFGTKTVQPKAFSGIMEISREIADASNPVIDQILLAEMRERYARVTEAEAYAMFNSATLGLGGTITNGLVPSGAQARALATATEADGAAGRAMVAGIRASFAAYPFARFQVGPNQGVLSAEATRVLAGATDTTSRPLLPFLNPSNSVGASNPAAAVYNIDGLNFRPAWSITGNAAGDFDIAFWYDGDVFVWESPLLMFNYQEVLGPGALRLALFGYMGVHVLRPVGLSGIRATVT